MGNAYAQIIRNGKNEVVAIYPLMPNKMTVLRNEDGEIFYKYNHKSEEVYLLKEDVLHIPGLGFDGLIGYSPITMAKNAIGMAMACEDYGASFFKNGAQPGGVLEHPGIIKDPERVRNSWNKAFQGPQNANKVKFNICNVHYALFDKSEEGVIKYSAPVSMPGAVSISLEPNGEPESFYADGIEYYTISNNVGYDGDLELALIPESFRTDVLMEKPDKNKVLIESSFSETANFALLFEFDGDKNKIRHILYNCSAARPKMEGKTNEESREVQPETISIQSRPLPNGNVKARTGDETVKETYDNWYKSVYMPTETTVTPSRASVGGK